MNAGPTLAVGQPQVALEGQEYTSGLGPGGYDVSPDGKRLLMVKEPKQAASVTQINVVLNWLDEVARLVPGR